MRVLVLFIENSDIHGKSYDVTQDFDVLYINKSIDDIGDSNTRSRRRETVEIISGIKVV